ncbi:MAG TPA: hypothetical protein VFS20_02200 [Longimicrobium sp.]|nr:hypothetical protein [Longimicrobium sp.]
MNKLQLKPEHLRVESFPVQNLIAEDIGTPGTTGLPATCPECPRTRNIVCYTVGALCD